MAKFVKVNAFMRGWVLDPEPVWINLNQVAYFYERQTEMPSGEKRPVVHCDINSKGWVLIDSSLDEFVEKLRMTGGFKVEADLMLGRAIDKAAKLLPEGYTITIEIERHSGSLSLFDVDGEELDFPSNHESLADSINDAIEFAIEDEINIEAERFYADLRKAEGARNDATNV